MSPKVPLNGTKTHPLSQHALGVLQRLSRYPIPRSEINPGVIDRLSREDLIELKQEHEGISGWRLCAHITDAGRAVLKDRKP